MQPWYCRNGGLIFRKVEAPAPSASADPEKRAGTTAASLNKRRGLKIEDVMTGSLEKPEIIQVAADFAALGKEVGLSSATIEIYYKAYLDLPEGQRIPLKEISDTLGNLRQRFLANVDDTRVGGRIIEAFGKLINGQRENLVDNVTLAVNIAEAQEKYAELTDELKEARERMVELEEKKQWEFDTLAQEVKENPSLLNFWTPSNDNSITKAISRLSEWDGLIAKQQGKIEGIEKQQGALLTSSLINQHQLLKNTGESTREVLLAMYEAVGENAPEFLKPEIDKALTDFQADPQASEVQKLIHAGKYDEALGLLGKMNKERTSAFDNDNIGNHDLIAAFRSKEDSSYVKTEIARIKAKPGFASSFAARKMSEGYVLKGVDDYNICLMKEGADGSLHYIRIDENGERKERGRVLVDRSNKSKLLEKYRAEKDSETTKRMTASLTREGSADAKRKIKDGYVAVVMGSTEGGRNLLVYLMKENPDGSVNCIETDAGGYNLRVLAAADSDIGNSRDAGLLNSFREGKSSLQSAQLKEKFLSKNGSFAAQKMKEGYFPICGRDLNKSASNKGIQNDSIYLVKENANGSLNYVMVNEDGSKGDNILDAETIAASDKQEEIMKGSFDKILREKPSFKALGAASKEINGKFAPLQSLFYKTLEGNKPGNFVELAKGYARDVKSLASLPSLRSNLAQARADLEKLRAFGETGIRDEFEQKILQMEKQLSQVAALVDSGKVEAFCNMILSADFEDSFGRWMIKDALPFLGAILTATAAIVLISTGVGSGVGGLMLMAGVGTFAGMAGNEAFTLVSNYIGKAKYGDDNFTNKTMLGKYFTNEKVFNHKTGLYEDINGADLAKDYSVQFLVGFATTFALLGCGQAVGGFLSRFAAANRASPGFKGMTAKLLSKIPRLGQQEIDLLNQKGLGNMMNKLGREFLEEAREEVIESAAEKGHPALGFLASLYHCLNGRAVSYKMGKYNVVTDGVAKTGDNEVTTNWSYDASQKAEFAAKVQAEYGKSGFRVEVGEDGTVTAETSVTLKGGSIAKNTMVFKPTTESMGMRQMLTEGGDSSGKSEIERLYGLKKVGDNSYEFASLSPDGKITLVAYLKKNGFVISGEVDSGTFTAVKGNERVVFKWSGEKTDIASRPLANDKEFEKSDNPKLLKVFNKEFLRICKLAEKDRKKLPKTDDYSLYEDAIAGRQYEFFNLVRNYIRAKKNNQNLWAGFASVLRAKFQEIIRSDLRKKDEKALLECWKLIHEAGLDDYHIQNLANETLLLMIEGGPLPAAVDHEEFTQRMKQKAELIAEVGAKIEGNPILQQIFAGDYIQKKINERFFITEELTLLNLTQAQREVFYSIPASLRSRVFTTFQGDLQALLSTKNPVGILEFICELKDQGDVWFNFKAEDEPMFDQVLQDFSKDQRMALWPKIKPVFAKHHFGWPNQLAYLHTYFKLASIEGVKTEDITRISIQNIEVLYVMGQSFSPEALLPFMSSTEIERSFAHDDYFTSSVVNLNLLKELTPAIRDFLKREKIKDAGSLGDYSGYLRNFAELLRQIPVEIRDEFFRLVEPCGGHLYDSYYRSISAEVVKNFVELKKNKNFANGFMTLNDLGNLARYFRDEKWPRVKAGVEFFAEKMEGHVVDYREAWMEVFYEFGDSANVDIAKARELLAHVGSESGMILAENRDNGLEQRGVSAADLKNMIEFVRSTSEIFANDKDLLLEIVERAYQDSAFDQEIFRRFISGDLLRNRIKAVDRSLVEGSLISSAKKYGHYRDNRLTSLEKIAKLDRKSKEGLLKLLKSGYSFYDLTGDETIGKLDKMAAFVDLSRQKFSLKAVVKMCERPDLVGLFYYLGSDQGYSSTGGLSEADYLASIDKIIALANAGLDKDYFLNEPFSGDNALYRRFDEYSTRYLLAVSPEDFVKTANEILYFVPASLDQVVLSYESDKGHDGVIARAKYYALIGGDFHCDFSGLPEYDLADAEANFTRAADLLKRDLTTEEKGRLVNVPAEAKFFASKIALEHVLALPKQFAEWYLSDVDAEVIADPVFFENFQMFPTEVLKDSIKVREFLDVVRKIAAAGVKEINRGGDYRNLPGNIVETYNKSPFLFEKALLDILVKEGKLYVDNLLELAKYSRQQVELFVREGRIVQFDMSYSFYFAPDLKIFFELSAGERALVAEVSGLLGSGLPGDLLHYVRELHSQGKNAGEIFKDINEKCFDEKNNGEDVFGVGTRSDVVGKWKSGVIDGLLTGVDSKLVEDLNVFHWGVIRSLDQIFILVREIAAMSATQIQNLQKVLKLKVSKVDSFEHARKLVALAKCKNFELVHKLLEKRPDFTDGEYSPKLDEMLANIDDPWLKMMLKMPDYVTIELEDSLDYMKAGAFPEMFNFAQKMKEILGKDFIISAYQLALMDFKVDLENIQALQAKTDFPLSAEVLSRFGLSMEDLSMKNSVNKIWNVLTTHSRLAPQDVIKALGKLPKGLSKMTILKKTGSLAWGLLDHRESLKSELGFSDVEVRDLVEAVFMVCNNPEANKISFETFVDLVALAKLGVKRYGQPIQLPGILKNTDFTFEQAWSFFLEDPEVFAQFSFAEFPAEFTKQKVFWEYLFEAKTEMAVSNFKHSISELFSHEELRKMTDRAVESLMEEKPLLLWQKRFFLAFTPEQVTQLNGRILAVGSVQELQDMLVNFVTKESQDRYEIDEEMAKTAVDKYILKGGNLSREVNSGDAEFASHEKRLQSLISGHIDGIISDAKSERGAVALLFLYSHIHERYEGREFEVKDKVNKAVEDNKADLLKSLTVLRDRILSESSGSIDNEQMVLIKQIAENGVPNYKFLERTVDYLQMLIGVSSKTDDQSVEFKKLTVSLLAKFGKKDKKRESNINYSNSDYVEFYEKCLGLSPSSMSSVMFLKSFDDLTLDRDNFQFMQGVVFNVFNCVNSLLKNVQDPAISERINLALETMQVALGENANPVEQRRILEQFNGEMRETLALIFDQGFGLRNLPELTTEVMNSITPHLNYFTNIYSQTDKNKHIIAFFMLLKITNKWDAFKRGEAVDLDAHMNDEMKVAVHEYVKNREQLDILNVAKRERPEMFADGKEQGWMKALEAKSEAILIGQSGGVTDLLTQVESNYRDLNDPDNFSDREKLLMDVVRKFGSKEVGGALAKRFKDPSYTDQVIEELQLAKLENEKEVLPVLQKVARILGSLIKFTEAVEKADLKKDIDELEAILTPGEGVIKVFAKIGEEMSTKSGAIPVTEDIEYLESILHKKQNELEPEELKLAQDYLENVKAKVLGLYKKVDILAKEFAALHESGSKTGEISETLKSRLEAFSKLFVLDQSDRKVTYNSTMTGDLADVIPHIRQCLGCTSRECNNDTNLTFGDRNRFSIITREAGMAEGKSLSDELVTLQKTVNSETGEVSFSFVMDNVYGLRNRDILVTNVLAVLKKVKQLQRIVPGVRVNVFVTGAALSSCSVEQVYLDEKLKAEGGKFEMKNIEKEVHIAQSASGDGHYEIGGGFSGRVSSGVGKVKGIEISLIN